MREILFRGKTNKGEWIEGCYLNRSNDKEDIHAIMEKYPATTSKIVLPETVGQYTGLTDKNGKKIFEGDIVKYSLLCKFSEDDELEDAEEKNEYIEEVKFNSGKFYPLPTRQDCEDYWYSWAYDQFEVIGNIHDNPELLKGGAE